MRFVKKITAAEEKTFDNTDPYEAMPVDQFAEMLLMTVGKKGALEILTQRLTELKGNAKWTSYIKKVIEKLGHAADPH